MQPMTNVKLNSFKINSSSSDTFLCPHLFKSQYKDGYVLYVIQHTYLHMCTVN